MAAQFPTLRLEVAFDVTPRVEASTGIGTPYGSGGYGSGVYGGGGVTGSGYGSGGYGVLAYGGGTAVTPSTVPPLRLDSPTEGILGVNVLSAGQIWADVSQWLRSFTTSRQSDRTAGQAIVTHNAGTLACTLNNADRRFDPLNLAGPYVVDGTDSQVEPMRGIRLTAVYGNAEYSLFRGYVDTWGIVYMEPYYGEANVAATDATKVAAKLDRLPRATPVGAGEYTGERINRILDDAGWTGNRDISRGDVQLQSTTLEGNALTEIQTAAQAEAGLLFVEGDGSITFRARSDTLKQPAQATSQATFGDAGTPDQVPYMDVEIVYDEETLLNVAQIARAGDVDMPVHEARDESSVTKYLPAVYNRTDMPFADEGTALAYAEMLVATSSVPDLRMTELTLRPRRDPARMFPQALGRRIGDRITVVRNPPGGGTPIVRECVVRGITHAATASGREWETRWQLSTAVQQQPSPVYFTLDSASSGRLDHDRLN